MNESIDVTESQDIIAKGPRDFRDLGYLDTVTQL